MVLSSQILIEFQNCSKFAAHDPHILLNSSTHKTIERLESLFPSLITMAATYLRKLQQ